jgi:DUF1009 family protein
VKDVSARPLAVLAGHGALPPLVAAAAARSGYNPVVFAIDGEAEAASFGAAPVHVIRWGEIGCFLRLVGEAGCREAVFIGAIRRRPDFKAIRPDFGALRFIPRILQLMRGGDDNLLAGVAAIFLEQGMTLVGPLDVAPDLALPDGFVTGTASPDAAAGMAKAADAARLIGRLDIGQAAVAVAGRVVAVEDAGGTDALLDRVAALRASGRIAPRGGVLVKCLKPQQDLRLDLPTIGPATADNARRAGLDGVAGEAGRTLLAGRDETIGAFRQAGLFLCGLKPAEPN